MKNWSQIPEDQVIQKTAEALHANGIEVIITENKEEAKEKTLKLIPQGSEVMTMTSVTLDTVGLSQEINKADGAFKPVRDKLYAMDRATQAQEMNRLGSAPEYAIGSVHAVTQEGNILIASASGSQLPAYAYGALHVVWVVGAQKIVENTDEGIRRIYEHTLPLESERAKKAYGVPGSNVSKLLIINKEFSPGRITMVLVKEVLGY